MSKNSVTIIIPTFNRRDRLERALMSVLQETRVAIQVHIFDNASTDDTEEFCKNFEKIETRVQYFRNSENIGAVANYRKAFLSVKSEYFIPLADDDWLLENFIFESYKFMQEDSTLGATVFLTEQRDENGNLETTYPTLEPTDFGRKEPADHIRSWMAQGHYAWSSILWRTEVLGTVDAIDPNAGLASDVDFQIQVFCHYPVQIINQVGAIYLSHENQNSQNFNILSVPSWSTLFRKLDKTIYKTQIITTEEYMALRKIMLQRYRGIWQTIGNAKLCDEEVAKIAIQAAFVIGDWDFTFSIISQHEEKFMKINNIINTNKSVFFPDYTNLDNETIYINARRYRKSLLSILMFFYSTHDHLHRLSTTIKCLEQNLAESERRVEIAHAEGALAQISADAARQREALQAEISRKDSQIRELQQSRWRRIGRSLGLAKRASFEA